MTALLTVAGRGPATGPQRLAQLANYVGPNTGGLRVVVDEVGCGHTGAGGSRLRLVPGPVAQTRQTGRLRSVTVTGPRLPGSGGGYHVLLDRSAVIAELDAFRPELVEVHDQTTLSWVAHWARRAGVPSLLFSHERLDLVAAQACGLPPWAWDGAGRWWAARLAARFDAVVCASWFAAEPFSELTRDDGGPVRVVRVPFGVDLDAFVPRPRQEDTPPWRPGTVRLVFAGRLSPEKAPGLALDVLARLRAEGLPAELAVLGDGPMADGLRRRAGAERLPVHFLGYVADRDRLAGLLAAADIAVSPGPRETFGLSVLEAMACGTPVVVSTAGGSRELVVPGAGTPVDGPEQAARAVRALLADPAGPARARERAEWFSWRRTWDGLAELRAELVAQPASRRRPRLDSNRSSRSKTSRAAHTRFRSPPEISVSTPASTSRSTAR